MGYQCFTGDSNDVVMLVTNLMEGDTIAVCPDDLVSYALGVLENVTGVQWAPITQTATDPNTGDATDEPETGDGPTVPDPAPAPAATPTAEPDGNDDQADGDETVPMSPDDVSDLADFRDEVRGTVRA